MVEKLEIVQLLAAAEEEVVVVLVVVGKNVKLLLRVEVPLVQAKFEVDPNLLNPLHMVPDITDHDPDPE